MDTLLAVIKYLDGWLWPLRAYRLNGLNHRPLLHHHIEYPKLNHPQASTQQPHMLFSLKASTSAGQKNFQLCGGLSSLAMAWATNYKVSASNPRVPMYAQAPLIDVEIGVALRW